MGVEVNAVFLEVRGDEVDAALNTGVSFKLGREFSLAVGRSRFDSF